MNKILCLDNPILIELVVSIYSETVRKLSPKRLTMRDLKQIDRSFCVQNFRLGINIISYKLPINRV